MYRYCQLRAISGLALEQTADAEKQNAAIVGSMTLGIEVTEPVLAARCGLGNIDPQHDGSGSPLAAIEAAQTWPLPPKGATLATIRPDLDAFGAMAVLTLRMEGRLLNPPMKARIAAVGEVDRHAKGPWPGPRPWPTSVEDLMAELAGGDIGILSAAMKNPAIAIDDRVRMARTWLETGAIPDTCAHAPRERSERLWLALDTRAIKVDDARAPGRMVEIVSDVDGALQLGYRRAPVVIALNPRFAFRDRQGKVGATGPKFTIAQWAEGHVDLYAFGSEIRRLEPGWGGSATIMGSPQGAPSRLVMDDVAQLLVRFLAKPA